MSANILAHRPTNSRSVSSVRLFRAAALATLLFFMLPVVVNAYTLVLRSGRVVNVSGKFKVTPTAMTYEASPGYWVTVWLSNVDIDATERANNEPSGSFTGRIKRQSQESPAAPARVPEAVQAGQGASRKVVTNKELESTRLMREAHEEEYERTRRERGLPSKQEIRQRIEEQDRWLSEWAQRMQEERKEAELESLKSEIVSVRQQLSELSLGLSQQGATYVPAYAPSNYYPYFYASPAQFITVLPSVHRGRYGRGRIGRHTHVRPWHYQQRPSHLFPRINRPLRGRGALLRAMPPARIAAPRRSR
ncbi:MAG TPA: hypothetical protein VD835_20325 [Pyrinomonadaceae bacterium]|nr:hypothetical protein [Pyrinomonadaceae bacterium]